MGLCLIFDLLLEDLPMGGRTNDNQNSLLYVQHKITLNHLTTVTRHFYLIAKTRLLILNCKMIKTKVQS